MRLTPKIFLTAALAIEAGASRRRHHRLDRAILIKPFVAEELRARRPA